MALIQVKNGDVYGAVKANIIGEIVGRNIWKNKFLEHVLNIRPQVGDVAYVHNHINERFTKPAYPKTYEFLFDFLGLDYAEVANLWANDGVEHMHFGLQGDRVLSSVNYLGFGITTNNYNYLGHTSTLASLKNDILLGTQNLNDYMAGVDKIIVSVESSNRTYSEARTFETEAEALADLNSKRYTWSIPKGYNSGYTVYAIQTSLTSLVPTNAIEDDPIGIPVRIRLFRGGVEDQNVYKYVDALSIYLRITSALEDGSTSITSYNEMKFIDYKVVNVGSRQNGHTYYQAHGINSTQYTFNGTFNNLMGYTQELEDSIIDDFSTKRPTGEYRRVARRVGSVWYPIIDYQARLMASKLFALTIDDAFGKWLIDTSGEPDYTGYNIRVSEYRKVDAREVMSVIGALLNIWVEEKDGGFWDSFVGRIISFIVVSVLILVSIIFTIITGGVGAPISAMVLGVAVLLLGYVGINPTMFKMLVVASTVMSVVALGQSAYTLYGSINTATTTTVVSNTLTGETVNTFASTSAVQAGQTASTVVRPAVIGGISHTVTTTVTIQSTAMASMNIVKNLAGAFSQISNLAGGLQPPDDGTIPPEDTAKTQEEVDHYLFTSGYDTYGGIYYNFEQEYDMDSFFG